MSECRYLGLIITPKGEDLPPRDKRIDRREAVRLYKEWYSIFTDHCHGEAGWLALSMNECCRYLRDENLTEEEKEHPIALLAGYCRLLDEAGLIEDGHRIEYEACSALIKAMDDRKSQ